MNVNCFLLMPKRVLVQLFQCFPFDDKLRIFYFFFVSMIFLSKHKISCMLFTVAISCINMILKLVLNIYSNCGVFSFTCFNTEMN